MSISKFLKQIRNDEEGAAMIEYVVIAGLIVAVSAGILITIGTHVNAIFVKVESVLSVAAGN